nr:immunoglobulin heavy chain junction region [Macaca mulatta]
CARELITRMIPVTNKRRFDVW